MYPDNFHVFADYSDVFVESDSDAQDAVGQMRGVHGCGSGTKRTDVAKDPGRGSAMVSA
jgi:hypothetical protein